MGRVEGKVALVTGAARGQGRAHALRLAEEGARIIALDICQDVDPQVPYAGATEADLAETARQVEDRDQRVVTVQADVRDLSALEGAVQQGLSEFGQLDIVLANAGIASFAPSWEMSEEMFEEMIAVNLTGVWKTTKAAIPAMIEQGTGGSIILTSSIAGLIAFPNLAHYNAAKHGVTGLMRTLALELAPHFIRCNSLHPTTVDTPMIDNPAVRMLFMGGVEATRDEAAAGLKAMNAIPVPWVEAVDIANAALFLASDESRYVTGTTQVIDAGATQPFKIPPQ
jgi:SDR family mycofactocin-dependent oxidoreductase